MNIYSVEARIEELVKRELPGCEVSIECVHKNNGVQKRGLRISEGGGMNVCPVIYLDDYLARFEGDEEKAAKAIVAAYRDSNKVTQEVAGLDFKAFFTWENIKNLVCVKLVSSVKNESDKFAHVNLMDTDLAAMFFVLVPGMKGATITLTNDHLKMFGVTPFEILEIAKENTKRILPCSINSMGEVLKEMGYVGDVDADMDLPMHIISNESRIFGAAGILDTDLMNRVYDKLGEFLIIPSSLHECIVLPYDEDTSISFVRAMIANINETDVLDEEILSDNCYRWDSKRQRVVIAVESANAVL